MLPVPRAVLVHETRYTDSMVRAIIFDCFGVIITDALKVVVEEVASQDPAAARQITDIIRANNRGMLQPAESNRRIAEILDVSVEVWRRRIDDGEMKDTRLLAYIPLLTP